MITTPVLRVGLGRQDITPEEPVPLNESHWCSVSRGVVSRLYARAVAFQSEDARAILISCDVVALPRRMVLEAREAISDVTHVPPEFILLAATQNHSSPKTIPADEGDVQPFESPALRRWTAKWKAGMIRCAEEALATSFPARAASGRGQVPGIAGNRRPLRSDGRAVMTWYRPDPKSIADAGVEDPSLHVVRVDRDTDGSLAGVLLNFSCHPNTLWTTQRIASDFPGQCCDDLERVHGESVIPVFFNGACGNMDPFKYMRVPLNAFTAPAAFEPGAPVHLCLLESRRFGHMLAGEAIRVAGSLETRSLGGPVRAVSVVFSGPLRSGVKFDPTLEVQVIAAGDQMAFVGIPGEPFLEIELAIRAASPFPGTFVCGHANGFSGYMPTRIAYEQGGYETGNAWTKFGPGIGEQVTDAAISALRQAWAA